MAKPIKLTPEWIQEMADEFIKNLKTCNMADGKISYTQSFAYESSEDEKLHVTFTPTAYAKMIMLLQDFTSEVAWHGVVERPSDSEFIITDILVYPQEVTGTTVNTDQEAYQTWFMSLDDDVANKLHMQGHSHVNMGVTPSGVDLGHQEQILAQLKNNDFYIFMIWNKSLKYTVKVYDLATNTLYENDDLYLHVGDADLDLVAFLSNARSSVKSKSYSYQNTPGSNYGSRYGAGSYPASSVPAATTAASKAGATPTKTAAAKSAAKTAEKESKKKAEQEPVKRLGGGLQNRYDCGDDVDYDAYIFGSRYC